MKVTHIANACCIYESSGYRILCDPWLTEGAFEGSWYHEHPLRMKAEDLTFFDALYLSHIHPDHFDVATLKKLPKDVLVIIPKGKFMEKPLKEMGYKSILPLDDGEFHFCGPFKITMYHAFTGHPFFPTELGNRIDSAIVIEAEGQKILNANDNTLDEKSARHLAFLFDGFDLAQLNYNCAGPYPACFPLINREEAHKKVLARNISHLCKVGEWLQTKAVEPFAGAYRLGGKLHEKNRYLGTMSAEDCKAAIPYYCKLGVPPFETIVLEEGEIYDLTGGGIKTRYEHLKWSDSIHHAGYPYEFDSMPERDCRLEYFHSAYKKLREKQCQLNIYPPARVIINTLDCAVLSRTSKFTHEIRCTLDPRLFLRILKGESQWNHAEIGCHIEFERTPEFYLPDVHWLLNYLHV